MKIMRADFTFLWEWEFDEDFIKILDRKCQQFGIQSYLVNPVNLPDVENSLSSGEFSTLYFYDRASDTNRAFAPIVENLLNRESIALNDAQRLEIALDKATMHQLLIENGIHVPYTIILSPNRDWTKIKIGELLRLGEPFIIKPALGGGGIGVELNAKTLFDIVKARESKSKEKFLLQEKVLPIHFGSRRAWFRVYYVCGNVIPCWWDDYTHIYFRVTAEEEKVYGLERLRRVALKIADITGLEFFSTEIAIVDSETFVVVDYVNDQCDMRLKSRHPDGVPDDVVEEIAFNLVEYVHTSLVTSPKHLTVLKLHSTH